MAFELLATSTMGLEAVVSRELDALGYENRVTGTGRVLFEGDATAICRANLWLRTAGRVLVRVGCFSATDFGELFDSTFALPWQEWIPADAAFPVDGRAHKSQLSSVPACQKIVKKALVEKLRAAHGVDHLPETGPTYQVEVNLLKDQATLTIDTSGSGLHKRGYRPLRSVTPLRETLAAGLVLLSFWEAGRPLVDPFCGSGTIVIEAAMIGRNIAPGLKRRFAAEDWPTVSASLWQAAREEARDLIRPELSERIIGTDLDEPVLSQARYHAQLAGVDEDIHFQQRNFLELSSKREYGCVIANPPYAEKLGTKSEVGDLYRTMPDVLRRMKTWSHFILTAYPDFEHLVGQQANRRRKLYNSRIECTYYQFHGPRRPATALHEQPERELTPPEEGAEEIAKPKLPVPTPAIQAFGGLAEKAHHQGEIFRSRLVKRARHLRRFPRRGITCYRIYDRDIPEVPLVVDRYEDCLHMSEYERPHDHTPAEHADWLDLMVRTAGEALEVSRKNIFLKRRRRQRGTQQHDRYAKDYQRFQVAEGGLKLQVNLSDYLDTGLFLDHRITRSMVRDVARGKRFLNLFGYTGAFTVYAIDGGAQSPVTVDLSRTYLDWAQRNLALNKMLGKAHDLIESDAMSFLAGLPEEPCFDLAVVDPPTFSNSKKLQDFWEVQRNHVDILNQLSLRMAPGGVVFFSSNFRRFHLDEEALTGFALHEISRQTVPEDFRNKRVHRCWRMVRIANA